ncbi:MAG: SufE family protein [Bacteroidales bacterium]|nr:SufE family protein [Bacteroidales bacterium]
MKSIEEIQHEIVEEFENLGDWVERYNYLLELAKNLPPMDEKYRKKENLIEGCQSQVWLAAEFKDGKLYFQADSDALITKGIVALLLKVFSGQHPNDILDAQLWFIDKIGLSAHLSPTRSNGLVSMIKQIRMYALAYKTKYNL